MEIKPILYNYSPAFDDGSLFNRGYLRRTLVLPAKLFSPQGEEIKGVRLLTDI